MQLDLKLKDDAKLVKIPPYQLSPPKLKIMRQKIKQLLQEGVIEPTNAPYHSPAFLVPKGNSDWRIVIDYRTQNKNLESIYFPILPIDIAFSYLRDATIFSKIDCNQAYHQIPLSDHSKPLTAFTTPWSVYQYRVLPFGLQCGSSALLQLMEKIFGDVMFDFVIIYLDDLLIFSKTPEDHVKHLKIVLERFRNAHITINPEKSEFGKSQVIYLGHKVAHNRISIDDDRIKDILNIKRPKTVKEISSFLGAIGFFGKFVPKFGEIAAPLNDLRKKGARFEWNPRCEASFRQLKTTLAQKMALVMPDFERSFLLFTDASYRGLSAILAQSSDDGTIQPIACASRKITPAELKWPTHELEVAAVIFGMEKFKMYLEHREFKVYCDNQALTYILNGKNLRGKLLRWQLRLSAFKFVAHHVSGKANSMADFLSRSPSSDVEDNLSLENNNSIDLQKKEVNNEKYEKQIESPVVECKEKNLGAATSQGTNDRTEVDCVCLPVIQNYIELFQNLRELQLGDISLREIMDKLEKGEHVSSYKLKKGMLMYRHSNRANFKYVIPPKQVQNLIHYFHTSPLGGHLGNQKTFKKINRLFCWPQMRKDINHFIKDCLVCQRTKPRNYLTPGKLSSITAEFPFQTLAIDLIGELPRSKAGNAYVLVAVDTFSKFVFLIPLKRATAQTVIRALRDYVFTYHGMPVRILSDRGPQFRSERFKFFCHSHGVKLHLNIPFYPASNNAERIIRNVKQIITAFHHDNHSEWDTRLNWLTISLNGAQHEATKFSPAKVFLGREIVTPLELAWDVTEFDITVENQEDTIKTVAENLKIAHKMSEKQYNVKHYPLQHQVGDMVLLKTHILSSKIANINAKLAYKWSSPYEIISKNSDVTYTIKNLESKKIRTAHVSQLKLWKKKIDV